MKQFGLLTVGALTVPLASTTALWIFIRSLDAGVPTTFIFWAFLITFLVFWLSAITAYGLRNFVRKQKVKPRKTYPRNQYVVLGALGLGYLIYVFYKERPIKYFYNRLIWNLKQIPVIQDWILYWEQEI